ncbi:MAG: superoxide dismutase [Vicinamibacterales bacterium]
MEVFNSAGQVLNHNFYWSGLTPNGGGAPTGALLGQIESDLGGMTAFRAAFHAAALAQFGSGWAWLVWKTRQRRLAIETTADADTPVARGDVPLLTLDVWEHACYLDHPARRAPYATAVMDKLINWTWASQHFATATA